MKIESEYIPETTTLEIVLEGKESYRVKSQTEQLLEIWRKDSRTVNVFSLHELKSFLQEVTKAINNPKPKENANKQGDL